MKPFAFWKQSAAPLIWTPAMGTGALHWWRGDLGITLTSGKVSQWADQVGAMHQNQATAGSRPTLTNSATFNNQQVLSCATSFFDGVVGAAMAAPITMLVVGLMNAGSRSFLSGGVNMFWRTGTAIEFFSNSPSTVRTTGPANSGSVASAWLFTDDGSVGTKLHRNDFTNTIATQTPHWRSTTVVNIGKTYAAVPSAAGEIAEVAIWSGVMSSGDRSSMSAYLNARYGFSTTP